MSDDAKNGNHPPKAPLQFLIAMHHKVIEVPHFGQRLLVAFQLQGPGGVPLSHLIELPGEVLPLLTESIAQVLAEFPALTTALCPAEAMRPLTDEEARAQQPERPSGLVDASGKPVRGNGKLKLVDH